MLLAMLLSVALAQDPAEEEPAGEPILDEATNPADLPEPEPEPLAPDEEPALDDVEVTVDRISFVSSRLFEVPPVSFDRCITLTPPDSNAGRMNPPDGQLVFQVTVRRGKVQLVSLASADKGLDFLTPCLQRELASVEWPVKRAEAEVGVSVSASGD